MGVRQELLSDRLMSKTMKSAGEGSKTRVNINIFLSQDVPDDGFSDAEGASHAEHHAVSAISNFRALVELAAVLSA